MRSHGHAIIAALCLVAGCGRADEPGRAEPTDEARAEFDAAQDRALGMSDGGRIVSRTPDGALQHTGDSQMMSGLGMAFMDCAHGKVVEDALVSDAGETGGELARHPSERHRPATVDQALGVWAGIASRLRRGCPGVERWATVGSLKPFRGEDDGFGYLRRLLLHRLGTGSKPNALERQAFETAMSGWPAPVLAKRAACYRVHLAFRGLRTMQVLGESVSDGAKAVFCKATDGAGLTNIDHWCGRGDYAAFLAGFVPNRWEYQFQRCQAWESPDGDGDETPGIDHLEALFETYAF
jgi:hypothetical protein